MVEARRGGAFSKSAFSTPVSTTLKPDYGRVGWQSNCLASYIFKSRLFVCFPGGISWVIWPTFFHAYIVGPTIHCNVGLKNWEWGGSQRELETVWTTSKRMTCWGRVWGTWRVNTAEWMMECLGMWLMGYQGSIFNIQQSIHDFGLH